MLEMPDGKKYIGEISMFEPNGSGKMVFENGDVYEGRFKRGVIQGKGKMEYRTGDIY